MRTEETRPVDGLAARCGARGLGWSPPGGWTSRTSAQRLEAATRWYRASGTAMPIGIPRAAAVSLRQRRSQELKTCSEKLVLNLEDDAPVHGERAVFLVDIMEPCWIFEGADLTGIKSIAVTVGQFPFNFQIARIAMRSACVRTEPGRRTGDPRRRMQRRADRGIAAFAGGGNTGVTPCPPRPCSALRTSRSLSSHSRARIARCGRSTRSTPGMTARLPAAG